MRTGAVVVRLVALEVGAAGGLAAGVLLFFHRGGAPSPHAMTSGPAPRVEATASIPAPPPSVVKLEVIRIPPA